MNRPSDENLMSYVDGVLPPEERAAVERAMADDPELRELVSAMQRSADLIGTAFDRPMNEPPPQRLVNAIYAAPGSSARNDGVSWQGLYRYLIGPRLAFGIAASVALLLAGTTGYVIGTSITRDAPAVEVALGAVTPRSSLATLLETRPSGSETPAGSQPDAQRITVVNTFYDRQKRPCREIELLARKSEGSHALVVAVACRGSHNDWIVEGAARVAEAPAGQKSGYVPSGLSEQDALKGFLDTLGATAALNRDDEARLIRNGWSEK